MKFSLPHLKHGNRIKGLWGIPIALNNKQWPRQTKHPKVFHLATCMTSFQLLLCPILILAMPMFVGVGLTAAPGTHSSSLLSDVLVIRASSETTPQACASVRMLSSLSHSHHLLSLSVSSPYAPISLSPSQNLELLS